MEISANSLDTSRYVDPQPSIKLTSELDPAIAIEGEGQAAPDATREAFKDFVGQTFFAELIKSLRSAQQPAAYFHGGRAEEVFQSQFDQVLSEELSDASADKISDPMFELFMLGRRS